MSNKPVMVSTNKLVGLASAIRTKSGETETMTLAEIPGKIPGLVTPPAPLGKVFSALIDTTNSDPTACITMADDAVSIGKGWSNWKDSDLVQSLKPCVLKDGEVIYYLNRDNRTLKEDGTEADITTFGNDVMLEIPNMGYMVEYTDDTKNTLKVSVTTEANKEGYNYSAFSLDAENDCDKAYLGVYKASASNGKYYSSSNKTPAVNINISTARNNCQSRGAGYQQSTFGLLTLRQCLYIITHGSLNSQATVGNGLVSQSAATSTGGTNTIGFEPSTINTTGKTQVSCLGIEDFWGNVWEWIDGLFYDSSRNVCTAKYAAQFNNMGANYDVTATGLSSNFSGYITKVIGGKAGFTSLAASGSNTTYWTDYSYLYAGCLPTFGGYWGYGAGAGAFCLAVNDSASDATSSVGARLCYLHKAA